MNPNNEEIQEPQKDADSFEKYTEKLAEPTKGRMYTEDAQFNYVAPVHIQPTSYGGPVIQIDFNALENQGTTENSVKPS